MAAPFFHVSLGFSCQTRFTLDEFDCAMQRLPFDFNITQREFILQCLHEDGKPLWEGDFTLYQMPVEAWQGIRRGGILFWHDFPLRGYCVEEGWGDRVSSIQEKYRYLWSRFREIMRGDAYKKIYVSNTQANLTDYTGSEQEFRAWFGLDQEYYKRLCDALFSFGARNFDITFLNRHIDDAYDLRSLEGRGEGGLTSRFVGILDLPCHHAAAMTLVPLCHRSSLHDVAGRYTNGCEIELISPDRAAIRIGGEVWGEIVPFFNGYLVFLNSKGLVWKATLHAGGQLKFNNNTHWLKLKP